jgi:hypothetical protein
MSKAECLWVACQVGQAGEHQEVAVVLVVVAARLGSVLQHRRPARAFDYIGNYRQSDNMRSIALPASNVLGRARVPSLGRGHSWYPFVLERCSHVSVIRRENATTVVLYPQSNVLTSRFQREQQQDRDQHCPRVLDYALPRCLERNLVSDSRNRSTCDTRAPSMKCKGSQHSAMNTHRATTLVCS